jgi:hypothetical protein
VTNEDFFNPGVGTKDTIQDMGFNSSGVMIALAFGGRDIHPLWAAYMFVQDAGQNMSKQIAVAMGQEVGVARQGFAEMASSRKHEFEGAADRVCPFCKQKETENNKDEVCASRTPCRYIWFVDDDVLVPAQTLRKLIDSLSKIQALEKLKHGKPETMAIGGVYCSKEELATPIVYNKLGAGPYWDWKVGEVFPCEGIGTGCLLIDTQVFQHLEKPWFKTVDELKDDGGMLSRTNITDDLYFCRKVINAGFRIACHGGLLCGHYDYKIKKIFGLSPDSPPFAAREAEAADLHHAVPTEVSWDLPASEYVERQ